MKTTKHGASSAANGKNCWLLRGNKKKRCQSNRYAKKNSGGADKELSDKVTGFEAKASVSKNADSVKSGIFDGENFDSTREATVAMGPNMSGEAYYAKAAYKHPILKHYSKF
tara:strand:+ start:411 stop:746 length:336 start_codon:yes stop_codon:yes gene_type:complete